MSALCTVTSGSQGAASVRLADLCPQTTGLLPSHSGGCHSCVSSLDAQVEEPAGVLSSHCPVPHLGLPSLVFLPCPNVFHFFHEGSKSSCTSAEAKRPKVQRGVGWLQASPPQLLCGLWGL